MCLIAIAYRAHPDHELVVAANRDEFHARPALAADWWPDAPQVWGGRDQSAGGSWMAVSREGRFAAVTNVRRMLPPKPDAPSRGALVSDFVRGEQSPEEFLQELAATAVSYAGFNLLLYANGELHHAGNLPEFTTQRIEPGIHTVSNASLNTPWPKSRRLAAAMDSWLAEAADDVEPLLAALADRTPAADSELPDTGVGIEMERFLSPPFICSERYGTRASTVVQIGRERGVWAVERRFDGAGLPTESDRRLQLPPN